MKWILVGLIVVCNAASDLLNVAGMRRQGRVEDFHPSGLARMIRALFHNAFVGAGVAVMALSFFALLALLSIANVSFAIPATGAGYLIETLLAKFLLKEDVRWKRWLGAWLVACGVALLAVA